MNTRPRQADLEYEPRQCAAMSHDTSSRIKNRKRRPYEPTTYKTQQSNFKTLQLMPPEATENPKINELKLPQHT
jgi:hypothetical protein